MKDKLTSRDHRAVMASCIRKGKSPAAHGIPERRRVIP